MEYVFIPLARQIIINFYNEQAMINARSHNQGVQ